MHALASLTGIQPSGAAHIGNLFGAMLPAIARTQRGDASVFIADLHALTTVRNAPQLSADSFSLACDLLALGLDPQKALIYRQSDIPQHAELMWILSTLAPMGLLQRAHSFKDKTARGIEPSVGLFTYPILMAADILLYTPRVVPVGKDQKQHLEIARDLAQSFAHTFDAPEVFPLPKPEISEEVGTIPGLDGEKMSKSAGNTIEIFLPPSQLRKKIMSIKTDSTPVDAPKTCEGNPIFDLFKLFASEQQVQQLRHDFEKGGTGYGDAKTRLADAAESYLAPIRKRREEIAAEPDAVHRALQQGAQQAREIAARKLAQVREAVGLA